MKLTRILLTLVLIPTFAFMAVCVCACPNAQAAVSNQLEFHKKVSCCCPENDNSCKNEVTTIQKDVASETKSFRISDSQELVQLNSAESSISNNYPSSYLSVLPANFSPPGILSVTSTVLLI